MQPNPIFFMYLILLEYVRILETVFHVLHFILVTNNLQHGQNPSCPVVKKRKNSWSTWNLMEF